MQRYIARRLIQAAVILFALSVIVFLLLRVAPGVDPAQIKCGLNCTEDSIAAVHDELGLDQPYFPVSPDSKFPLIEFHRDSQYGRWIAEIFSGSLGRDINQGTVAEQLQARLPVTIELLIITMLVTITIGVPFGVLSAVYRNSPVDYSARFGAILGLAIPNFWLATLVLFLPQEWWGYAPPLTREVSFLHFEMSFPFIVIDDPWGNLQQFVPPAIVLGAVSAAGVMRLTRSAMLEVMRQDYIRTARSKGLQEYSVIVQHALKNSLIPVVTVLGLQLAALFGGAVIVEQVFNLEGVGKYFFTNLARKDFQVVQSLTLYIGAVVILLNLAVDIMYAWLDPRIRYS